MWKQVKDQKSMRSFLESQNLSKESIVELIWEAMNTEIVINMSRFIGQKVRIKMDKINVEQLSDSDSIISK